ncbi:monocarboxylate transporter 10-like isoform X2 [Mizuhopecten yessoensis]|uniref:monocarboxylate transporter 10-like isoform X2 n=1 Tax=Mizuhopecten yessoensis TaxID=6573 RepID=UPI000B45F4BA|nr:monocarboxylate transporter 10-like isoform X2 [Mizuhopecten yessoensis]
MAPVAASNPGGSWGYVVGVAAFMIQFVTFGIAASIGVYNIAFLEHFQSSVAATSMIGAFNIGLLLGGGPLASFLMRKMSYRKVSFLGSLLSSIGLLFCPFAPNIIYLDVFYGVVTALLLPVPVSKKTKDTAQTDELVVMLTGTTNERTAQISNQNGDAENKSIFETESASNTNENLRTSAEQYQRETTKTNVSLSCNCITAEKEMKNCYVLCNIIFLIYCINNIFWNMGLSMVFVLGPGYFTEFGLSIEESTICLMCFNATITVGGIVGGGVGNLHCINRMVLYIMANFITGVFILMLAMPFVHTFGAICLDMLGMGLVFGIILGLLVVVTVDILGVQSLGDGMGYLLLANGIGNTVGPPIGGWIKDLTGSCMLAFYLAGTVTVVAGGVMLIAPVWECFLSKTKHQVEESRSEGLMETTTVDVVV